MQPLSRAHDAALFEQSVEHGEQIQIYLHDSKSYSPKDASKAMNEEVN
ncbi:hypothetical protein ACH4TX_35100 [Streptomyces sp. NPDC021098]